MDLIQGFDSNYRFVLVAAKRARQLLSGARPQIETETRKPCKIAQQEIQAGKVKWETPETPRSAVAVASDLLDTALTVPDLGPLDS
jgi:DNA-directed RNA polymerase subunit omega